MFDEPPSGMPCWLPNKEQITHACKSFPMHTRANTHTHRFGESLAREQQRTNDILKEFVEQIGEIDKCRVTNWLKIVGNEVVDFAQDDV